jgi:hypothetical protein
METACGARRRPHGRPGKAFLPSCRQVRARGFRGTGGTKNAHKPSDSQNVCGYNAGYNAPAKATSAPATSGVRPPRADEFSPVKDSNPTAESMRCQGKNNWTFPKKSDWIAASVACRESWRLATPARSEAARGREMSPISARKCRPLDSADSPNTFIVRNNDRTHGPCRGVKENPGVGARMGGGASRDPPWRNCRDPLDPDRRDPPQPPCRDPPCSSSTPSPSASRLTKLK